MSVASERRCWWPGGCEQAVDGFVEAHWPDNSELKVYACDEHYERMVDLVGRAERCGQVPELVFWGRGLGL